MKQKILITIAWFLLTSLSVTAQKPIEIPEMLEPWVDWVLYGQEKLYKGIPVYNDNGVKICAWPGELALSVNGQGGVFSQSWDINCETWVSLPGSEPFWPLDILLNGEPAITVKRNGIPSIKLTAGNHLVTGRLKWNSLPEHLSIPKDTALITLDVDGVAIEFPRIDEQGRIWFQAQRRAEPAIENRLSIQEYRLIRDSIPPVVTVLLKLDVSGKAREAVLGPIFSADQTFIPLSLTSALPTRIDPDGRLVIQVRPGQWSVELKVRGIEPLAELMFERPEDGFWPNESVWAFEAQPHLRVVEVSGASAIDPQQTMLPENWRHLPAWRMTPGDRLIFSEMKRGEQQISPDQLTLDRKMWLRFDGSGLTNRDQISGRKNSDWRMEMAPPLSLNKVEVDGAVQFITRREGTQSRGVEVRRGQINLVAESDYSGNFFKIPLTGWNQHFQEMTASLALPPGYRLIHATGFEAISDTWISQWQLWDMFFVLLITALAARLISKKTSVLAFVTIGLLYHEINSPRWIWLALLIGIAFLKYLPKGRLKKLVQIYQIGVILFLVIFVFNFAVDHLRASLFPQLETVFRQPDYKVLTAVTKTAAPALGRSQESGDVGYALELDFADVDASVRDLTYQVSSKREPVLQYDPKMALQTGPGLPEWAWRTVTMSSGPVRPGQTLTLFLIGPITNMILGILRVLLMIVLAAAFLEITYRRSAGSSSPNLKNLFTFFALMLFILMASNSTRASEFPSPQLLDELRMRLLKADDCFPNCADITNMSMRITPGDLTLSMIVNSRIDTAIPLPGHQKQWLPQDVTLDQQRQGTLIRSGEIFWMFIPEGRHQIDLKGLLPQNNTVQVSLPMKPGHIDVQADGWSVEGIRDNGSIDNQIQFQRLTTEDGKSTDIFESGIMPPFVQVERSLLLGLEWRVVTRVHRLTPLDSAIILEIPLIPGESVITESVDVKGGFARVNLDMATKVIEWESVLEPVEEIVLKHMETHAWTEEWEVDVSPIFHLEYDGIPVIMHQQEDRWLPKWRPWPGEEVRLTVARPEGVGGQTLTIQKSVFRVDPGKRVTECELNLVIHSGQGTHHVVRLPEGAEAHSVQIDGRDQPMGHEGRDIRIAITPGKQNVRILWRENRGISFHFKASQIDLGIHNANANIEMTYPKNRWPLWVYGPRLGPAVLFWPLVMAIFLGALILGRTGISPMKTRHWLFLGLGMTQSVIGFEGPLVGMSFLFIIVIWIIVMHFRSILSRDLNRRIFDLMQIAIAILTFVALISMISAIGSGLVGHPDMSITGNSSYSGFLKWYVDSSKPEYPPIGLFSIPVLFFRLAMLLWALWAAFYMMDIMKWAWACFSKPYYWRPFWSKIQKVENQQKSNR